LSEDSRDGEQNANNSVRQLNQKGKDAHHFVGEVNQK